MLTKAEVDRRFLQLVADLNSTVLTVDWACVSDPAESLPSRDPSRRPAASNLGALRFVAVAVALVTFAVGVVLARRFETGLFFVIAWFTVAVPGVTLASLLLLDRLRNRRPPQ